MHIGRINFENLPAGARVTVEIFDDVLNTTKNVFFSVPEEYKDYLITEVEDAFVYAAMVPALVTGQDIIVEGAISDYFYNSSKTLIYLLSKAYKCPEINIICDSVVHVDFKPEKVGAAFSGGIDSLATFINHSGVNCPEEFRISQLALFNVGAYGNDYEKSHKSFEADAKRAAEFAEYVNLPLVLVDSNVAELYTHEAIYHNSVHVVFCLFSAIIELQKLWKVYYKSSSYRIDTITIDEISEHFDSLLTQLSSNNCFQIFIAEANMSRVDKTKLIANSEFAKKFLYVCSMDLFVNNHGLYKTKSNKPNCSECNKCYWTMITLDYLGVLKDFDKRFDFERYYRIKRHLEYTYYAKPDANSSDAQMEREIVDLMFEKGWKPPLWLKIVKQMEKSRLLSKIIGNMYHMMLRIRNRDTYKQLMNK